MPFCPNSDCPHRRRLGKPAEFKTGEATCSDCGSSLSEVIPLFEPSQKPKTATGWKCPECGSINREEMALCSCGYDSNRPIKTGGKSAKGPVAAEVNASGFGGVVELTERERKFAEISAKRYREFFYRNSQTFGWFGVILFTLGLFRVPPLPEWCHILLVQIGFIMIFSSTFTFAMIVVGKLYAHIQGHEKNAGKKNILIERKKH